MTFSANCRPNSTFVAETRVGDLTAQIKVRASVAADFRVHLAARSAAGRSAVAHHVPKSLGWLVADASLQLAATAAQFAGEGGNDAFEKMRKSLGVNSLDVQMRAGGPTVGASRYISDNVSVGVRTGATPEQSAVSIDIDVTRAPARAGRSRRRRTIAVGIGTEWEI